MAESTPKSYSIDPALYLYTSLTSGSSNIVTATSRMETILKANRIPFKAIDIATDEKARMLWGRRAGKDESGRPRKIPGLVQMGLVVGDLVEIEDWNEYGELKQHVKIVRDPTAPVPTPAKIAPLGHTGPSSQPSALQENKKPVTPASEPSKGPEPTKAVEDTTQPSIALALRQAGQEAAQKAKDIKKAPVKPLTGVGEAEPSPASPSSSKQEVKAASIRPKPIAVISEQAIKDDAEVVSSLQSPNSTAWKTIPLSSSLGAALKSPEERIDSIQSPTSTAWKPTHFELPVTSHRGSSVSLASAEEIKQIEDEAAIAEEDEEEDDE